MYSPCDAQQNSVPTLGSPDAGQRAPIKRQRESKNPLISEMRQLFRRTTMKRLFPHVGNPFLSDGIKNVVTVSRPDRMCLFVGSNVWKVAHRISVSIQNRYLPSSAVLLNVGFTENKSAIGRNCCPSRCFARDLHRLSTLNGH